MGTFTTRGSSASEKGSVNTTATVPRYQVANVVSPATVNTPAGIIAGAVSQAGQNAINGNTTVQGGAQLGSLFDGTHFGGFSGLFGGSSNGGVLSNNPGVYDPSTLNPLTGEMVPSFGQKAAEFGLGLLPGPLGMLASSGAKAYNANQRVQAANDYMREMGLSPEAGEFGSTSVFHEGFNPFAEDIQTTVGNLWYDPEATKNLTPAGKIEHERLTMFGDDGLTASTPAGLGDALGQAGWNDALAGILAAGGGSLFANMSPNIAAMYGYNSGPAGSAQSYFPGGV